MRRAKDKLRNGPGGDMIAKADTLREERKEARTQWRKEEALAESYDPSVDGSTPPPREITDEYLNAVEGNYQDAQRAVERVTLENALAGGGIGAIGGGVGATALESVIRSLKPTVSYEEEV